VKHQGRIDPARLVFLDETWTKTNMAPLRGWAPRGQRLRASVPHGHWKTMTFLAALRCDRVEAPWLLDGPIDGDSFRLYVERVLVPTLRPGDIVVMDNLGSHKSAAVRQAKREAKTRFALLQTPDFIEEFILDRTLEPALDAFGLHYKDEQGGFRLIDPTVGSGHFLLGAFPRILRRWQYEEPTTEIRVLAQRAQAMAASYAAKTGRSLEEVMAWLSDGQDHWFTASEAVARSAIVSTCFSSVSARFPIPRTRFGPPRPTTT
jgi:hypothetical protein